MRLLKDSLVLLVLFSLRCLIYKVQTALAAELYCSTFALPCQALFSPIPRDFLAPSFRNSAYANFDILALSQSFVKHFFSVSIAGSSLFFSRSALLRYQKKPRLSTLFSQVFQVFLQPFLRPQDVVFSAKTQPLFFRFPLERGA